MKRALAILAVRSTPPGAVLPFRRAGPVRHRPRSTTVAGYGWSLVIVPGALSPNWRLAAAGCTTHTDPPAATMA